MPRSSCGSREVGCVILPDLGRAQPAHTTPSGRGQPMKPPFPPFPPFLVSILEPRALAADITPHWAGPGMRLWTQLDCQLMPQTCRHVTLRTGAQGNPPPLLPPPSHSQGRGSCFSQSFHSHPCLPTTKEQQPLAPGTGPCPPCQGRPLPGSLPTLMSSLRHEAPA